MLFSPSFDFSSDNSLQSASNSLKKIHFDELIFFVILAKEFLLDFAGLSGILNAFLCTAIVFILLNPRWKIPGFIYCFVAALPFVLFTVPFMGGNIEIAVVNLLRIVQVSLYGLFFVHEAVVHDDFYKWIVNKARPLFSTILLINILIMAIQYSRPGTLIAASDGVAISREDMISGLFGYGSTHAVALFTVFVVLINLDAAKQKKRCYLIAIALAFASLFIATLNDNKALFFFLPIGLFIRYLIYYVHNYKKTTIKLTILLPILFIVIYILVISIPSLSQFIDEHVVSSIDIAFRALDKNSYVNGSDERFKMIALVFSLPGAWAFGDGIGKVNLYEEGYRNFNHFGLSDFGSIAILCGLWIFTALCYFYAKCFSFNSHVNKQHHQWLLTLILFAFFVLSSVYTQPFTQVRIAIPTFLVAIELAVFWNTCLTHSSD